VWKRNQVWWWSSSQHVIGDSHMRCWKMVWMIILPKCSSTLSSSWDWWRNSSIAFVMANGIWDAIYSETTRSAIWADVRAPFCKEKKEYSRTIIVAIRLLLITCWTWNQTLNQWQCRWFVPWH
jgi:hypothetical protein